MIYIKSSKRKFFIKTTGENGETLNHTENFSQKKNAWVNIEANAKQWNSGNFAVKDEAFKNKAVYHKCWIADNKLQRFVSATVLKT